VGKRRGQSRVGYRKLTPTYKARLARNGISQRAWEDGADLRKARGHTKDIARVESPLPDDVITDLIHGRGEPGDFAEVSNTKLPSWIPTDIRADVAAALSQLPPPYKWEGVVLYPKAGGNTWGMKVTLNNTYHDELEIEIPGGGEELSGAHVILQLLSMPPEDDDAWANWDYDDLRIDRTGSS